MILEATSLKEGTGKELRRLHDTVQQHLRALRAIDYQPSGPFITSVLELKLDTNTMFEWQRFSQDSHKVPHYQDLLEFLNLRAQASESSLATTRKVLLLIIDRRLRPDRSRRLPLLLVLTLKAPASSVKPRNIHSLLVISSRQCHTIKRCPH